MKDIKILAIIVGVVTDVGATQVILIKFIFFAALINRIEGQDVVLALLLNPPLSIKIPEWALGGLGSFLGGFVAARMARKAEIKNTLLMGLLSNATGLMLPGKLELWFALSGAALTFLAATLGGYLSLVIRREEK